MTAERVALHDQPLAVLYERGSLWVTTGMHKLLRLKGDRIIERFRTGVSRVDLVAADNRMWMTGGGDGAVPDGTLLEINPNTGDIVRRISFPADSPYGIDTGPKGLFVALFQGDLVRVHPGGDTTSRIPLGEGLTEVLVAHNKVWVSQPQRGNVWRVEVHGHDTKTARTELRPEAKRSCPQGLDFTESFIWVADPCAGRVWLLDPRTGKILDRIRGVGRKPMDLSITKGLIWIVSSRDNLVTVLDAETFDVLGSTEAENGAASITAHGRDAWVANSEDYSLTQLALDETLAKKAAEKIDNTKQASIFRLAEAPAACRDRPKVRQALRRSAGITGEVDGDGRFDLVYLTYRKGARLGVCLHDGTFDELPTTGQAEIIYLTDLEKDGREEILFGGNTVTIGYHNVGVWRGGRIRQLTLASGKPFVLVSGYGFDGGEAHEGEMERAFGCEGLDKDGTDEFVQVIVRREYGQATWTKLAFSLEWTRAIAVAEQTGPVVDDHIGVATELVEPCRLKTP